MSPRVHEALAELVAERGEGVMTDPDQFRAALDDHLAESAAPAGTIYLLTDAVRLGALEALRSMVAAGAPAERAVEAAGERLARDRGSIEPAPAPALWACAALGYAVGVVPASVVEGYDEPGTRSREEPAPAPSTTPVAPVAPPTLAAHPLPPPPLPPTPAAPAAALPPPPAAYVAPPPYVPPDEGGRRIGPALLIGALAVLVMVGVGTGTAYLLTRDRDSGSDGTSDSTRDAGTDDPTDPTNPTDPTDATGTTDTTDATDATSGPTATATVTEDGTDPEAALRDIIAADAATVSGLVGYWVPQLASISGGINGSWEAALAEYEELKSFFSDVVLLDAADWQHAFMPSETFDDVFVVLSPTPASPTSAPVLDWCQLNRGDREASCYAKLIETSGSPRDNTDQNDPEPEYN